MTQETLSVHCADGHQFSLQIYAAEQGDEAAPVLLMMPAMGVAGRFYKTLGETFAAQNQTIAVAELRGIGTSNLRASRSTDFGYAEILQQDIPAALASLKSRYPKRPVWLMGHSLGGQLNGQFAALNPTAAQGLILVASCSTWFRGWSFPVNVGFLMVSSFYILVTKTLGYFPGQRLGFGGLEAATVMGDWWHTIVSGQYRPRSISDNVEQEMRGLALPVLAISIKGDHFAPQKAVQNLVDKFSSAAVTHEHFGDEQLSQTAQDHFRWAKEPEAVVQRVLEWIRQK